MSAGRFQNRGRATTLSGTRKRRQWIIGLTVLAVFLVPSFLTYEIKHNSKSAVTSGNVVRGQEASPVEGTPATKVDAATATPPSLPPHVEEGVMPTSVPSVPALSIGQQPAAGGGGDQPRRLHPAFPNGAPIPLPYRLDTNRFSAKQRRVAEGIRHAFVNYKKYAWGHDELSPLRKTYVDWSQGPQSGIGLTAIESLDTMWLAGLYDEFQEVIAYLKSPKHSFDRHIEVGIFETTIRVLGGLLSSYELSGEEILLDKAYDIGKRLFHCIERRTIPYASVFLDDGHASNPGWLGNSQSLAEVTTIQLEFKKLSYFTGEKRFDDATTAIMRRVLERIPSSGLFSIYISMNDGSPLSGQVTLGARGDSFYEYLAKQWALTNFTEDWLREGYERVASGVVDKLLVQTSPDHAFIAETSRSEATNLEFKMDHLVCFVVGMLQIGKHGSTAAKHDKAAGDIARTCYDIYRRNPTGLGVEIVRFRDGNFEMYPSPGAYHYIMRPEVMEAMFYMQRFHPEEYDVWGSHAWAMYEKMEEHLKVQTGWVGLADATVLGGEKRDKMESFFVAETLKYAFLCAADKDVAPTQLPLSEWVFNTEAHPLRVLSGPLA